MKTTRSLLFSILLLPLLAFAPGCKSTTGMPTFFNPTPQSLENKAFIITQLAAAKVLQKHPNAIPKMKIAADDLQTLETAETIGATEILAIVNRLPPDTFSDPNTGLYIQAGVLFFADELGAIAAKNPDQLRAAARGMRRGLEAVIASAPAA